MATRKSAENTEEKKKVAPEDFVEYGDGYANIELSRGIDVGGVNVKKLRMREPTVRDQTALDKMKGSDLENEIATFANLCEMDEKQILALPVRDYRRLTAAYMGFIV